MQDTLALLALADRMLWVTALAAAPVLLAALAVGLVVGIVQAVTGWLILQRHPAGIWLGAMIAFLSAMLTVFVMFVFPLWEIAVLTLDFLVIYALLTRSDEFERD